MARVRAGGGGASGAVADFHAWQQPRSKRRRQLQQLQVPFAVRLVLGVVGVVAIGGASRRFHRRCLCLRLAYGVSAAAG